MTVMARRHDAHAPEPSCSDDTEVSLVASAELFWRGEDARLRRRWSICFAAAASLHLLPVLVHAWWLGPLPLTPAAPPPSAITIEMAPVPAVPPVPPPQFPPGPPQPRVQRPQPSQAVRLPRMRDVAGAPPSSPQPQEPRDPDMKPVDEATAPPAVVTSPAPAASPASSESPDPSQSAPDWKALLLGQLERFKRYPSQAQSLRQHGVVYLRFTMKRDGGVRSSRLERSSGYPLLDREALALLQRAQPLPKPPSSVAGDPVELVVPIEFFFSRHP